MAMLAIKLGSKGPKTMTPDTERRSRAELIRNLYENHRGSYPAAILAAGLVALLFRDSAAGAVPLLFFLWMITAEVIRAGIHLAFAWHGDSQLAVQLERWERAFYAGGMLSAIGWGLGVWFLFPQDDPTLLVALTLVLVTVNALVTAAASAHLRFVSCFLAVSAAPFTLHLLLPVNELALPLLLLLVTVFGMMLAISFHSSRHMRELLELRFSYSHMAQDLADEIFAKQETESRLDELAHYDSLTGLANRGMFREQLSRRISELDRKGQRLAVVFLDIDRFKAINDSLGHATGDALLREVARRLNAVTAEQEMVARQSSDEFLLCLQVTRHTSRLSRRIEEIIRAINEPIIIDDRELRIDCSVGIAFFPDDGHSAESLIQHADLAMVRAKKKGTNNYHFFQAEMHRQAMQRLAMETSLRRAIDNCELHLNYQPQVDSVSGKIVGIEALARWQDPEHGNVSPADFIPLAEDTGLIAPLGKWVLREACQQARLWEDVQPNSFYMSVNLSVGQFDAGYLVDDVRAILEETGLPAERLVLEITESLVMDDPEHHIALLRELKSLGLRLALDDFGTGYSSLSYLRQLPIDILKLDRQFVQNVAQSGEEAAIARATITMAAEIGLQVVAEGVETAEQLRWLLHQDCHLVQGFFFSRPLSSEDLENLIRLSSHTLSQRWPKY